ncbi:hypothetical protein [Salinarimonas soli]|uniref:Uncharacterized protein n=1 Tax=Salinarimonas soli TaxID=1638099 RepID=A0A5B2VEY9_9HYPH|nr:hypothetical protein [Salinarimonas soli]KAA2236952.1 hypothetical protein F0L46_11815 [Salinarimonas soli]
MAEEQLRLVAKVTDEFSGPLRKLRNDMASIAAAPHARAIAKDWSLVGENVKKSAGAVQTDLMPALSRIGVVSLGASSALGAVALAVANFAIGTKELTIFSKETGVAVERLRVLQSIGERFNVSNETINGGLKQFADNFDQIRRRWGSVYSELRAMGLGNLAEDLVGAGNVNEAIDRAFKKLSGVTDPVRRRRVAQLLFGTEDFGRIADAAADPKLVAETAKRLRSIGQTGAAAALEFNGAMSNLRETMQGLQVDIGKNLLPPVTELVKKLNEPVGGELKAFAENLTKAVDAINRAAKAYEKDGLLGALKALDGIPGPLGGTGRDGNPVLAEKEAELRRKQKQLEVIGPYSGERFRKDQEELRRTIEKLTEEIGRLRSGGATVQQQSFGGGGGFGGLIQNASLGGFGSFPARRMGGGGGYGGGSGDTGGGDTAPTLSRGTNREVVDYITRAARARGIDPNVALRVARSEGLNGFDPDRLMKQHGRDPGGDKGTSFGPFQLHYRSNIPGLRNPGLGDAFTRKFGTHASDPRTWRDQVDFALDNAAKGGWGPWHGWRGHPRAGLDGARPIGKTPTEDAQGTAPGRGATARPGDALMGQSFGGGTPKVDANGTVNVFLDGAFKDAKVRTSMDGLFREVNVNRGRSMQAAQN